MPDEPITTPTAPESAVTPVAPEQDETAIEELIEDMATLGPQVVKETKEGYKTTEFWVMLAGVLTTQLGALHLPGKYGDTIATVAMILGYIISRGFAKLGVPTTNEKPEA